MSYLKNFSLIVALIFVFSACSSTSDESWRQLASTETSFIIIPGQDATIQSVLQSEYIPFLDDVTSSALQLASTIDSSANQSLSVKSILLYPGTDQKLQPVWVTNGSEDLIESLKNKYAQPFAQNEYQFHNTSILNLKVKNRHLHVAHVNELLLLSESSLGIEQSIRSYLGLDPVADFSDLDTPPGSMIINTPALDRWIGQLGRVTHRPSINNAFSGTRPAVLTVSQDTSANGKQLQFTGEVGLSEQPKSSLIRAVSSEAKPITLDEYISSNAAAFGIFHVPFSEEMNTTIPDTTSADAFLLNNETEYIEISRMLGSELGLVAYTESGFLSAGEHLFIRKATDTEGLRAKLEDLSTRNLVEKVENAYFVQSYMINQLIGSELSNFKDFYIKIIDDAVVLSKRKGLAEMVASDRNRRRTVTYEEFYKKIEETLPENISSFFVARPDFYSFLQPFLTTENYVDVLASPFDYITLTTQLNDAGNAFSFKLSTFNMNGQDNPYRENWSYSTGGTELSGKPIFGNVGGSFNDEVVFATETGSVYVLAGDGSFVQQYNTGSDVPVGSPVIYDWYGTGDNVVMIAAGNKIYGWDENGNMLPKFPFELAEQITTPLTISDINNNKMPDAIVGTADRKLHVLNGRGNNLQGWPVTTNARITAAPRFDYIGDQPAIIAFSANAVHAWNANGNTLSDYPIFVDAGLKGSPVVHEDRIFGNAVDGSLYSVGSSAQFSDSLETSGSSQNVSAVYVSSGSLAGSPSIHEPDDGNNYSGTMILTTSASGSVFLLGLDGQLHFTKSMGQPISENTSSFITDINSDGSSDIVALANYGRLYAWNIENGERIFDLPTAGISHMNITDLDGDGLKELVGQTENGIRSWTINRGQ